MSKVVYSQRSQAVFDSLHERLRIVLTYIKDELKVDHSLLCGYRSKEDQDKAVADGVSQVVWPNSKHNHVPALAVDVIPYVKIPSRKGGVHWHDEDPKIREAYYREMVRFATLMQCVAKFVFGFELRWGGDWDRDWSVLDNRFNDYPHPELV